MGFFVLLEKQHALYHLTQNALFCLAAPPENNLPFERRQESILFAPLQNPKVLQGNIAKFRWALQPIILFCKKNISKKPTQDSASAQYILTYFLTIGSSENFIRSNIFEV